MHKYRINKIMPLLEPLTKHALTLIACFLEQRKSGIVICGYHDIELMKMQRLEGIVCQLAECRQGITLPAMGLHDDDASLSTLMLRVEMNQVGHSHHVMLLIFHDKTQLAVSIDIVGRGGQIVMKGITAIRHIGSANMPKAAVVLYLIEHIEVFRFYSAKYHFSLSLDVLTLLGLTKRFSWSSIICNRASEARK